VNRYFGGWLLTWHSRREGGSRLEK